MVLNFGALNFFLKYKLLILAALSLIIISLSGLRQMHFKVDSTLPQMEPIDVVYTWVNGSDPKFLQSLQKYLNVNSSITQDYSTVRFDDKYELKFSLRSLEKYAPWIHHVFIVTDGQIPYWLNLDYEKVTLVTHKEIFINDYDLPSFSSPAIESHLHRIPGLSKRFIYFNDDIFVGAPIYIEDFVSQPQGFLIYLTWPLPMCALDCPWVYVGDGQCDIACYNSYCQFDGNDCDKINKPWENINFMYMEEMRKSSDIVLPYHQSAPSQSLPLTIKQRHFAEIPKVLNNSKIGLESEPTIASPKGFLHTAVNVRTFIKEHNTNVIRHNKLRRRKRNAYRDHIKFANSSQRIEILRNTMHIDTYGASLQHTNRIYNLVYGFKTRYVPAHAPVMIDKHIMIDFQKKFKKEVAKTSRNRIRSNDDIQYAFSYYYYLMNEKYNLSVANIFDHFDTDQSGTWSDREIRTILSKIYELPLSYSTVDHFEDILVNCSKQKTYPSIKTPDFERYIDSKLPTVTKDLVVNCPILSKILKQRFGSKHKYKFEVLHNTQTTHATFRMLNSNISDVVAYLDEIRRYTRKFVCLNDNMDSSKLAENDLIRAVLYDFYMSLFPIPSKFELPTELRNRFYYVLELNKWKNYHFRLKLCAYVLISFACSLVYCNLFKRRLLFRFINKMFR